MSESINPLLDLSEIVDLYKEDARKMVASMHLALDHWEEVASGGPARYDLRKLSHQLRGSGRTYGFRDVSRIGKAIERVMIALEGRSLNADERTRNSVMEKIERLAMIFRS